MSRVADNDRVADHKAIDLLLELYVSWREECRAAREAYRRWDESDPPQRELAFARFSRALDREEHAARAYAAQVNDVSRVCL